MRPQALLLCLIPGFSYALQAAAQTWVEYYRSGTIEANGKVIWDYNEIDVTSVRREGKFIQYQVRIRYGDGNMGKPEQMQADCAEKTRGQLPDPRMSSTYKGTVGGDEVIAACAIAERRAT